MVLVIAVRIQFSFPPSTTTPTQPPRGLVHSEIIGKLEYPLTGETGTRLALERGFAEVVDSKVAWVHVWIIARRESRAKVAHANGQRARVSEIAEIALIWIQLQGPAHGHPNTRVIPSGQYAILVVSSTHPHTHLSPLLIHWGIPCIN